MCPPCLLRNRPARDREPRGNDPRRSNHYARSGAQAAPAELPPPAARPARHPARSAGAGASTVTVQRRALPKASSRFMGSSPDFRPGAAPRPAAQGRSRYMSPGKWGRTVVFGTGHLDLADDGLSAVVERDTLAQSRPWVEGLLFSMRESGNREPDARKPGAGSPARAHLVSFNFPFTPISRCGSSEIMPTDAPSSGALKERQMPAYRGRCVEGHSSPLAMGHGSSQR